MGKIIALVNEKGGVAKTTTTKNVSIGFGMRGKKVLVLDIDPSMSLTSLLDLKPTDGDETIADIIENEIEMNDMPMGYGIRSYEEGIDVITSSARLHSTEQKLNQAMQREVVLRNILQQYKDEYDYIFIDCPAGLGIFTVNALFAADEIIIPMEPHVSNIEAIQSVFKTINMVRKYNGTGKKPEVLGALFTMVRPNTNNDKVVMEQLRKLYGEHMRFFDSIITMTSKIPETEIPKCSIYKHAPNSAAAMMYSDLTEEILKLEEGSESNGR